MHSKFFFKRRKTRVVPIGDCLVGGDHPIRIQSMTIADTLDTETVVQETIRLAEAGCEIVRITAQNEANAKNLGVIKAELKKHKVHVPLIADIHFSPKAAMEAALHVEKVRVNPGNFVDKKRWAIKEYTDVEYQRELDMVAGKFIPLVDLCKKQGVSMRIGTNHGSLSDRILNRYGDTPLGMVESALEFITLCESRGYYDIILSMKSSIASVMIEAYRLLALKMDELGMNYPFHLGVTEAGNGEEGRIKSIMGIGTLLEDGIGDTIRVSLTEDSVNEIPVARNLANYYSRLKNAHGPNTLSEKSAWEIARHVVPSWEKRSTVMLRAGNQTIGGDASLRVIVEARSPWTNLEVLLLELKSYYKTFDSEKPVEGVQLTIRTREEYDAFSRLYLLLQKEKIRLPLWLKILHCVQYIEPAFALADVICFIPDPQIQALDWQNQIGLVLKNAKQVQKPIWIEVSSEEIPSFIRGQESNEHLALIKTIVCWLDHAEIQDTQIIVGVPEGDSLSLGRLVREELKSRQLVCPVLLSTAEEQDTFEFYSAVSIGGPLCEGLGNVIRIRSSRPQSDVIRNAYQILQASRKRMTQAEFISCPSCGRTLFDLEETTAKIKAKTDHLKGVKIAIMGCIVNGLGEMADADFGYVGWGKNQISLYVGKELVERDIPETAAADRLVELIKAHGMWIDPPQKKSSEPISCEEVSAKAV